ncbi:MAG TPA: hypothetical protein VMR97_00255 [Acidimicrobiales bacterium]|nr:hypothetical protein [Acidimicrobiales bacterium]
MAVIQSVISRVQPGRFEDMLGLGLEVTKLYERLGCDTTRLMIAGIAGEVSGQCVFSSEHESMTEYGAFQERLMADSEMQSILSRVRSAESPVTLEQQSIAGEIPLGRTPKAGRGSVVEVHVSTVTPGRLEDVLALGRRVCDFVEANGALNARNFQMAYAGTGTGMMMASWEHESLSAWGKTSDAFQNDPEGQAIAASVSAPNPPSTLVFSGVYTEIPL